MTALVNMEIAFKPTFQQDFRRLPPKIQDLFRKFVPFLKENSFHPLLHTKPLAGAWYSFFSFRLTKHYRCIFRREGETIVLYFISHRKDVYR